MSENVNLHTARRQKNDDFYTQLVDIENECQHYESHFKGAWVYSPCDLPHSQFVKYFVDNFERLGLAHYTATGYPDGIRLDYDGKELKQCKLAGDGDFRSGECSEIMRQADIVVTNPPFSLFREYVAQLVEHEKRFLIIGNMNAITYKDIFPLIQDNRIWLGHGSMGKEMLFDVPAPLADWLTVNRKEGSAYRIVNGMVKGRTQGIWFTNMDHAKRSEMPKQRFGNITWFTNLGHPQRHKGLTLNCKYDPMRYPHYDNCDAIEVSRVKDIPMDWNGLMGVPITFLNKHNPEQFDIVRFRKGDDGKDLAINGRHPYIRILIRRRTRHSQGWQAAQNSHARS